MAIPDSKPFRGKITISRTVSNTRDDYISVGIRDERGYLLRAQMELADFASCITGLVAQPLTGEIRDDDCGERVSYKP